MTGAELLSEMDWSPPGEEIEFSMQVKRSIQPTASRLSCPGCPVFPVIF
jgi:hypothetical protein